MNFTDKDRADWFWREANRAFLPPLVAATKRLLKFKPHRLKEPRGIKLLGVSNAIGQLSKEKL